MPPPFPGLGALKDIAIGGGFRPSISFDRGDSEPRHLPPSTRTQPQDIDWAQVDPGFQGARPTPLSREEAEQYLSGTEDKPTLAPFIYSPEKSSDFSIDPEDASSGYRLNEIAYLEAIAFEDRTPEQTQRLDDLYKEQESITAKGRKGKFRNELLMQMLPQLFSQPFEQSEADRQYAMEMRQYQDQQRRRAEEQAQEKQGRQQAFALIPKLFPDLGIDLSSFGGELDPSLIPALIQMAQLRASKRNQRMAQPVVRFA